MCWQKCEKERKTKYAEIKREQGGASEICKQGGKSKQTYERTNERASKRGKEKEREKSDDGVREQRGNGGRKGGGGQETC